MRALVIAVIACGCGGGKPPVDVDPEARAQYPDLAHLYDGDHGIYRGCGPNGGVCHNGNEFPNLNSVGSIIDTIGRDCNQKRDKADAMHDMCERTGDLVEISGEQIEIGSVIPVDGSGDPPRIWTLTLRHAPVMFAGYERMKVYRGTDVVVNLHDLLDDAQLDPADATRTTVRLTLTPDPGGGNYDLGAEVAKRLARVGVPGAADGFLVGDPNRNGIFGAELGAKFIKPGDPQRSYLLRRLTDPSAGPLMPRANCCFWTKPALRALWCWVAGLDDTAGNALAPINYDKCPPSPTVELDYPEPGESCETAGKCPIIAIGGTNQPTFPSIYSEVLVPRCGGEGCHDREPFGGQLDMRDEESAYTTLGPKIVPGDPDSSILARRIDPAACQAPCVTMPLGRTPLGAEDLARIRKWIADGAARD